jgi:hypothetical protein
MKKLVATLSLAALTTGAWAQGFVSVAANGGAQTINTNTVALGGTSGATVNTASAYYYDVLINSSTITTIDSSLQGLTASGWSDTGITGYQPGGLATSKGKITAGNTSSTVWAAGNFQSAIVIGWSAGLGTTWAQVAPLLSSLTFTGTEWTTGNSALDGQVLGYTTIANAVAGSTAGTATSLFASGASSVAPTPISGTTTLYGIGPAGVIPEPGTLALAGLGVASLLIFRRRK